MMMMIIIINDKHRRPVGSLASVLIRYVSNLTRFFFSSRSSYPIGARSIVWSEKNFSDEVVSVLGGRGVIRQDKFGNEHIGSHLFTLLVAGKAGMMRDNRSRRYEHVGRRKNDGRRSRR